MQKRRPRELPRFSRMRTSGVSTGDDSGTKRMSRSFDLKLNVGNSGRFQPADHCSVMGPDLSCRAAGEPVEGLKRVLKAGAHQAPGNEYEAGACSSIRPGVEMGGRVDRMLDTVNDHRRRNIPNVQHALHAKNILAVTVQQ